MARARHGRLTNAMDGRPLTLPHRLLAALLAAVLLAAAAATGARADDETAPAPQLRWPVGGPALATAMDLGAAHWGRTPCGGHVRVSWTPLPTTLNANSSWAYAGMDPYGRPQGNSDCAIALSTMVDWDWEKLCTVVVHEVGHLDGHGHSPDPDDVMYDTYVAPVPDCAGTPEPDPSDPVLSDYRADVPPEPTTVAPRSAPAATKPAAPKAAPRRAKRPAARKARRPAPKASARARRGH